MEKSKTDILLEQLSKKSILRMRDMESIGISRAYLSKLCQKGRIQRIARGLYCRPDIEPSESHSLAEVAKQVPRGVICLLSALGFHRFTTQLPHEVWVAIDFKARKPKTTGVSLKIVRFSGKVLNSGIEKHRVYDIEIQVYSPAKTVADCFKYRNKIGLDVALEALREGWRDKLFTMNELGKFAEICRVSNVMRPYLESLTTL